MSKLIVAPNFTQIPNIIFDHWMFVLTPAEFKVLLCICRKTFGWGKKEDRLSRTYIAKLTNLNRDTVRKAIQVLEENNLIIKHQSISELGDNDPNLYEINVSDSANFSGGVGDLNAQGLAEKTPTRWADKTPHNINTNTKENITKEEAHGREPTSTPSKKKSKVVPLSSDPLVERAASHPECDKFSGHFKRPLVGVSDADHQDSLKKEGQEVVDLGYQILANWNFEKGKTNPEEIFTHTDIGRLRSWGFREARERLSKNDSKAIPGKAQHQTTLHDTISDFEQKKAICERIRGIVEPYCNNSTFFLVNDSEVFIECKIKDIRQTLRFGVVDVQFKEKLFNTVEIVFPRAYEKLKENKKSIPNLQGLINQIKR